MTSLLPKPLMFSVFFNEMKMKNWAVDMNFKYKPLLCGPCSRGGASQNKTIAFHVQKKNRF